MNQKRFYKSCPHASVGSNLQFHGIAGYTYVTDIDNAATWSRDEAEQVASIGNLRDCVNEEMFLSVEDVDPTSVWKVDCQYISLRYPDSKDPNGEYVAYAKGVWDGNDLGFSSGLRHNFDYSKATVFSESDIASEDAGEMEGWVFIPKFHSDEVARRTFQTAHIGKIEVIRSA